MRYPQIFLPVGHAEDGGLQFGQVDRGVDRARDDGAGGAGVVVGGRHLHDLPTVAVGDLEDGAGDVGPGQGVVSPRWTRTGPAAAG